MLSTVLDVPIVFFYVSLDDGSVVGHNSLVLRLLKGVFQSRPSKLERLHSQFPYPPLWC